VAALSALIDYLDPVNLITAHGSVVFKAGAVEAHATAQAHAKAKTQTLAAAAANPAAGGSAASSPTMKRLLALRQAKAAEAAAVLPTVGLVPSISEAMLTAAKMDLISQLATRLRTKFPSISEALLVHCSDTSAGSASDLADKLLTALVDPAQANLDISDLALGPFQQASPAKCWVPFDTAVRPRQRAALIIYLLLSFYTALFHSAGGAVVPEDGAVEAFSPLALERIAAQLELADANPIIALLTGAASPASSPAAAPKAASKKRKRGPPAHEEKGASAAQPIPVDDTGDAVMEQPQPQPPAANDSDDEGAAVAPPPKRTKRSSNGNGGMAAVPIEYFKLSKTGNTVAYRPPADAPEVHRLALCTDPQPIRTLVPPSEALRASAEGAFNLVIDPSTHRPSLQGAPRDFTLLFTNAAADGGSVEGRLGSLQVTFVYNIFSTQQWAKKHVGVVPNPSDIKNYKPLYSDVFAHGGGASTDEFRTYFNDFVAYATKRLSKPTTLADSMLKLDTYNQRVWEKRASFNGAVIVIAHTARGQSTRDPGPRIYFPYGVAASIDQDGDDEDLRKAMQHLLHHSRRAYLPHTDPATGTEYRPYTASHGIGAHAGDDDLVYQLTNDGSAAVTPRGELPADYRHFAAVCLCCVAPLHLDDFAAPPQNQFALPALPLLRCAGCSPALRARPRHGHKQRGLGLCPNH